MKKLLLLFLLSLFSAAYLVSDNELLKSLSGKKASKNVVTQIDNTDPQTGEITIIPIDWERLKFILTMDNEFEYKDPIFKVVDKQISDKEKLAELQSLDRKSVV